MTSLIALFRIAHLQEVLAEAKSLLRVTSVMELDKILAAKKVDSLLAPEHR